MLSTLSATASRAPGSVPGSGAVAAGRRAVRRRPGAQPGDEALQPHRLVGERAELLVEHHVAQAVGHRVEALGDVTVVGELGVVEPAAEHALVAVRDQLGGRGIGVGDVEERRQQAALAVPHREVALVALHGGHEHRVRQTQVRARDGAARDARPLGQVHGFREHVAGVRPGAAGLGGARIEALHDRAPTLVLRHDDLLLLEVLLVVLGLVEHDRRAEDAVALSDVAEDETVEAARHGSAAELADDPADGAREAQVVRLAGRARAPAHAARDLQARDEAGDDAGQHGGGVGALRLDAHHRELGAVDDRAAHVRGLGAARARKALAGKLLAEARLLGDDTPAARVLVSPRRIAVLVEHVPARQTAKVDDFRGPKAEIAFDAEGKLTKAGEGFARSRGAQAADVRRAVVDGTEFAVVRVEAERADAASVLPGVVAGLITGLQIPRGMRWGTRPAGEADYLRFSRPIRWIVCKLGGATVPGSFYGLVFGDVTQGHRVLGAPVVLDKAEHYEQHLEEQKVVVSQHERRRAIVEGLDARAAEAGGSWSDPGDVLAEAVYLAEWPSVARGAISGSHLRLPDPVLVTAMQSHQRYFPVRDGEGRLLPAFLYVSNADPAAAELITHGNERVLGGRLDDAEFAYDRDVAEGLDTMADRLRDVVFHEKLGSLADKAVRLQGLVAGLGAGTPADGAPPGGNGSGMPREEVLRMAARLAKADLVSQVVIEFPVLQGEMGGLYAMTGGFGEAVARAVGEHYWPLSATAPLPGTLPGALLAVADKVDNIAGAWVAGQKPSGSRDPYGLRRAAMGIVRIALEYSLRFPIAGLLASAVDQFELQGAEGHDDERRAVIVAETAVFVRERLQALLF